MNKLLEHTRRPDITFCRNGRIFITARVARILSLHPGDTINIIHDKGEYLLFANRHDYLIGRHIARSYPTKKKSNNYCANSVALCKAILSAVNSTADKVSFMVGEHIIQDEKVYVPIITRHPI